MAHRILPLAGCVALTFAIAVLLGRPAVQPAMEAPLASQVNTTPTVRTAPVPAPDALSTKELASLQRLHGFYLAQFEDATGRGLARLPGIALTMMAADEPDTHWNVEDFNMIGAERHDPPVVYLKRQVRSHHTAKNAPHRAMNRFETAAISKLPAARAAADIPARWRISPEDVIVERQSNGDVRVLGAIRTTKSCYDCHATKEGELLGAFTYTLRKTTRQAELTKKLLQARPSTSEPTQGF